MLKTCIIPEICGEMYFDSDIHDNFNGFSGMGFSLRFPRQIHYMCTSISIIWMNYSEGNFPCSLNECPCVLSDIVSSDRFFENMIVIKKK